MDMSYKESAHSKRATKSVYHDMKILEVDRSKDEAANKALRFQKTAANDFDKLLALLDKDHEWTEESLQTLGLKANEHGGIAVHEDVLKAVWKFLCEARDPSRIYLPNDPVPGTLRVLEIKAVMKAFYPQLSCRDIKVILGKQEFISFEEFRDMVKKNRMRHVDPVKDAFMQLSQGRDYIEQIKFTQIFRSLGAVEVDQHVMSDILDALNVPQSFQLGAAGVSKPRRIDLETFRKLVDYSVLEERLSGPAGRLSGPAGAGVGELGSSGGIHRDPASIPNTFGFDHLDESLL